MPIPVLFGLGANLGEPARQLAWAVDGLRRDLAIDAVSNVYRTEPVGRRDQPDFLNLVVSGTTTATVYDLHATAQAIEAQIGRRPAERNAPRVIDVDLLAYGELALSTADLMVPHPRLHQRSFVLVPLAEIAPGWLHPLLRQTAAELLSMLDHPSKVFRLGPLTPLPSGAISGYSPPPTAI